MKLSYVGTMMKDLVGFARENKAWWIVPLMVVLLLAGVLVIAGQGAAPFIYTLF
jgi:hypothetical protein